MWKEHTNFEPPTDTTVIWRYLDFTKFVDLLETETLYFTRSDKFGDRFEGSYPRFNIENRQVAYGSKIRPHTLREISRTHEAWRRFVAINCWHMNQDESDAMWKLYLKSNEGIAIRTTYKSLVDCFSECPDTVYIGKVKYIDYNQDWLPEGNLYSPFLYKRNSFQHENELRALVSRAPETGNSSTDLSQSPIHHGLAVPIKLECLLDCIFIAPDAPQWFKRLVSNVSKKYGLETQIEQSILSESPVY